ncbi:DUF1045 domain-containing protein [Paracoccus sp. (in: a-proteobacteria)]|uniref:DUF1045 domain-containing protein n=1 Tax=Paracoccus sp. TaxID=267 RepID=UPI003220704B
MRFRRLAIYHLPEGELGAFGAAWLGWDARLGAVPAAGGLRGGALTEAPCRYGFHATLKAPFRLAANARPEALALELRLLCDRLAGFSLALELCCDCGFVALRPRRQPPELVALESALVTRLDHFRAPLTAEERARRNPDALPARARAHLEHWGYPHVLDLFHYHLTLSGTLPPDRAEALRQRLAGPLAPLLARPAAVGAVALTGEDEAGFFHLIEEFPLRG